MNTREQVLAVAAELRSQIGYFACEGSAGKDWANHLADKLEKIMAQTQQPAAWLHEVVAGDGEPDQALSFSKDNFPLEGVVGYRSIGCEPLYRAAVEPIEGEREEMSPAFTDTSRAALAWVLYHHQGGNSPVGQPIRFALGMGQHERLPDWRIAEAKRYAASIGATSAEFHNGGEREAVAYRYRISGTNAWGHGEKAPESSIYELEVQPLYTRP